MDLLNLGLKSRKTGLRPRENLRKDKYDMEDIDEFFADEDDHDSISEQEGEGDKHGTHGRDRRESGLSSRYSKSRNISVENSPKESTKFNTVARKINFTDAEADSFNLSPISIPSKDQKNEKSPLRSPLQENKAQTYEYQDISGDNDPFIYDVDNNADTEFYEEKDMSLSPVELSPIKIRTEVKSRSTSRAQTPKQKLLSQDQPAGIRNRRKHALGTSSSALTKNMALASNRRKRRGPVVDEDLDEDSVSSPPIDTSELLSPPPTTRKEPVRTKESKVIKETIYKPSPLPSPPPDGLRRSKRTKISPLAFWRNERIVYTRANERDFDPDSTLGKDINKVPLQEIKEVVHIPEADSGDILHKKRSKGRTKITPPKSKKSLPKQPHVYDYESDPEISGSEWFSKKHLNLRVFEGPHDQRVSRPIAWAPNEGEFVNPPNSAEIENFKVATLFGNDRDFTAGGMIEFPYGGFKSLRNSSDSVYIFHVVQGLIEVTLNDDKFVVTRGCSFQVPRANSFAFKNLSQDKSKLFFVQSKKVSVEDDDWD